MRISDWSSDVCSSDLRYLLHRIMLAVINKDILVRLFINGATCRPRCCGIGGSCAVGAAAGRFTRGYGLDRNSQPRIFLGVDIDRSRQSRAERRGILTVLLE